METKKMSTGKTIFIALVTLGILWYFFGGGLDKQVINDMKKIENQVALDAEEQYKIAKEGGDKMQTYVQASMVAAAYLQAKDQDNYNKWKVIEKEEAINAGMPVK